VEPAAEGVEQASFEPDVIELIDDESIIAVASSEGDAVLDTNDVDASADTIRPTPAVVDDEDAP
jgi:hypothetical protein